MAVNNDMHLEKYSVPGLVRGIKILKLFNSSQRVLTGSEMAQKLNIPRSTVFRIVQTLEHLNLLEKVPHSQAFRLGVGVLSLGFEYVASLDITELGRPVLDKLSNDTGLSSHLVIRDGQEAVIIYKSQGHSVFSSLQVGTRLPAHGTILGRMLLMELSAEELCSLFPNEILPTYTQQTPKSRTELMKILAQDRSLGYAISNSYFENGISSIAAPVRGPNGLIAGAINVTITGDTVESVHQQQILEAVLEASHHLSASMNYQRANAINQ